MALYSLKFHPDFVDELAYAIDYYNKQAPNLGKRFRYAVKKQLILLKKSPLIKSIRYDDIRLARIEKFPYAIHYFMDLTNNWVLVHSLTCDYQKS